MITKEFFINNEHGIHARPSALLAKIAQSSSSTVQFINNSKSANGHSTLELLCLAACKGSKIIVNVNGNDEIDVMKNIEEAFNNNFQQSYEE